MRKVPFILKDLSIRKMPGFPRGLESISDFASNINIITGVNASGKSSIARVIQQLIWQDKTKGLEVDGSVIIDEDLWGIKIDSEKIIVQRNGNQDQINGLPTLEGQHRYLLALHKLVGGKENDLAKEIAKQSVGGFDLDAAQKNLGYSSKSSNRSISEYKKFEEAEDNYKNVRNQQKELKKDEGKLNNLNLEKDKAQYAARLNEFYNKLADYLEANSEYTQLLNLMNKFPESMEKLSGEEYARILELESEIKECQSKIEKAKDEIAKSQKRLKLLTISGDGISDKTLSEIEKRLELLSDYERDIRNYNTEIAGLKSVELNSLNSIDKSIKPEDWKELNIDDVSGLDKMLKDAHQVLGEKEYLLSEIKILEEEAEKYKNYEQSSETFSQGIKTLGEWLKEPISNNGLSFKLFLIISLVGVLTAIATFFVGWFGLFGIILIVFIFAFAYLKKDKGSNSLGIREQDFINSGLNAPSNWDVENVAKRIDELIENLKDIKDADRISQRLINAKNNLNRLEERIDNLHKKREERIAKLQTAPGFPENNSSDFSSLYWFLINVKKWQDAHIERVSSEAKRKEITKQYENELDKTNTLFEKSNFIAASDVIDGKANFKELKTQENLRKEQIRLHDQRNEKIIEQNNFIRQAKEKLSNIYQTLNISENDKESVQDLVNRLGDYKLIYQDHHTAKRTILEKERFLRGHSLYSEYEEAIKYLSVDQANDEASKNKEIANQLENIQEQITSIEIRIQERKKGHELEDVLNDKENALDRLNQLYENNLSSAAGDLIINQLKKETRNQNRPLVFKRANEILNKITNGRYELLLGEGGEPKFMAYDTVLRLGQDLSELSTGTRVQLLLSIRLAYVETVESSIKLPLLADELLANSDDERAKAIIDALIEISREGRQVFYFTAQADEVSKWLTYLLEAKDIEHKIIQLDGMSNKPYDYTAFNPDLNEFTLIHTLPEPNGKSHKEYGEMIFNLPFNALIQNRSELPLWYLIEDVNLLYACLKRGIKTWGQLESYYSNNGKIQNFDEANYKQLHHKIELLNRFQELYQKGRSRQIDRDVLEASGAVSGAFVDKVVEKLGELNREPKQLIQALRDGSVPGFRKNKTDELEQYLITEGYVDNQEVMELEAIIINMHALISNFKMEIQETEDFIVRVLKSVDFNE